MPELEHIFIWGLFGFCASLALDLQRRIRSKPDTDYDEDKLRAAPPPFRPIPRTSPDWEVRITPHRLLATTSPACPFFGSRNPPPRL